MSDIPMIHRFTTLDGRTVDIDTADVDDLRECVRYLARRLEIAQQLRDVPIVAFPVSGVAATPNRASFDRCCPR
jgi:hypothetical protein